MLYRSGLPERCAGKDRKGTRTPKAGSPALEAPPSPFGALLKGIGTAPPTKRTASEASSEPASSFRSPASPSPLMGLDRRESAALPAENEWRANDAARSPFGSATITSEGSNRHGPRGPPALPPLVTSRASVSVTSSARGTGT